MRRAKKKPNVRAKFFPCLLTNEPRPEEDDEPGLRANISRGEVWGRRGGRGEEKRGLEERRRTPFASWKDRQAGNYLPAFNGECGKRGLRKEGWLMNILTDSAFRDIDEFASTQACPLQGLVQDHTAPAKEV